MTARPEHPISVSADRLAPLLDQARGSDINVTELLTSLNLDPGLDGSFKKKTVSLADYYRLQNRLGVLFGDETLHFSSRQLLHGSTDYVLRHVGDAKTLFDAMRVIAQSYNLLHGGEFNAVVKKKDSVDYIIDDRAFSYAPELTLENQYFSIECTLIFLHCMLMIISPTAETAIKALQIRRRFPGGDCGHLAYWNASIKFGADTNRLSFDRDIALSSFTPPASESLTSLAVYQKIVDVVAGKHAEYEQTYSITARVRDALSKGAVEQTEIAAQMGVSVATLRRRLSLEGASFRELRREVLNETAKRLLSEQRSVSDVSEILGFSEYRAFIRAFRDWNGMTPKAFVSMARRS